MTKAYEQAIIAYTKSLSLDSSKADVYEQRAKCFEELKKYDLAIKDLEKAKQLDSSIQVDEKISSLKTNLFLNEQLVYILLAVLFLLIAIVLAIVYFVRRKK
jgi:tetratricopeptide (TPR) repeat protein